MSLAVQSQVSSFKHFGLDKSIFPSRIECIAQASSGELLIGTLAGLVVYDGYSFRTLGVAEGLAESSISSIEVHGDEIVLGHWAGNLTKYDLENGRMEQALIAADLNFSSIKQTMVLSNGIMLLLTAEGKVYSYKNSSVERVLLPLNVAGEDVVQFAKQNNALYLILETQILKSALDATNFSWEVVHSSASTRFSNAINVDDNTWLIGSDDGAFSVQWGQPKTVVRSFEKTKGRAIQSISKGMEGEFWLATEENGVMSLDYSTGEVKRFTRESGLSYNQIRDVFIDRENTVWIGTTAGLDQYLGDAFTLYDHRGDNNGSLIWDILAVSDYIYALTSKGIVKYPLDEQRRLLEIEKRFDLEGEVPQQIIFDGDDALYVQTADGALWKGSFSRDSFAKLGHLSFSIQCMAFVNGQLLLGTNDGVYVMENDQAVEHLTADAGLGGNRVTGIHHSSISGETWITALGSETTLYHEGKFKKFGKDQGLASSVIQDAAFDLDGDIWFASYDKGVFYREGDQFKSISDSVVLTSTTSFAIAIDHKGIVWIGHNWGIDRYDHHTKKIDWYGEDEGFMGVEVNPGSMIIDQSSHLFMGTLMGVLRFDPSRIVKNEVACLLDIKKASLGTHNVLGNDQSAFVLSASNDLTVNFKGISLQNPAKNKFLYRLKGAHENWRTLTNNQSIEYLSLPVGDFVFELKAYNNSGVCSETPATFAFTISPPFYKTWWFYTLLFIAFSGLIVFMDRYRVVNLLEQNRALEEKLSIKDQELLEIDEERAVASSALKSELTIIKTLEQRDTAGAHLATEMFPHFASYGTQNNDISSQGIITISSKDYRLVLFTDVHVQGISAHAIRSNLKSAIWDRIPIMYDQNEVAKEVAMAISSLEKSFAKFKGINWLLCIDNFSERIYHKSNTAIFSFTRGTVEEVGQDFETNSMDNGFKVSSSTPLFVCSNSLFEQLNEAGTKTYSKERIAGILKKKQNTPQSAISTEVLSDIETWRGAMEQFNDVEFYMWNHE